MASHRATSAGPKLLSPIARTLPSSTSSAIADHDASSGVPSHVGQCASKRSSTSTPRRRSDASHSRRTDAGDKSLRTPRASSSHTSPHLVKTSGRSGGGRRRRAWPTTRSERPKPYAGAVSTQLTPASTAWWMARIDWSSSCVPHPPAHSPPPIAHAPSPTRLMSSTVRPSDRTLETCETIGTAGSLPRRPGPHPWPSRPLRRPRGRVAPSRRLRTKRATSVARAMVLHDTTAPPAEGPADTSADQPFQLRAHHAVIGLGLAIAAFTVLSGIVPLITGWDDDSPIGRVVFGGVPGPLKLAFYTLIPMMLVWGSLRFAERTKNWERGRPAPTRRTTAANAGRRFGDYRAGVYMRTLLRDPAAGFMHSLIYFGFLVLLGVTTVLEIDHQLPEGLKFLHGRTYQAYALVGDLAGVAFVGGLLLAV